jgi:pantoate--beta-alanine ligase
MIVYKDRSKLSGYLKQARHKGISIGFVPTMGALHEGHLALVANAKNNTGITVCSIFVNPTQFNDPADFKKYPITIENDLKLLYEAGTDIVFLPEVEEIYPAGLSMEAAYSLGKLETILEGKYRPGHFQGVCQVVHRLLEIVSPDKMFMGQKDYQQCMVIDYLIKSYNISTQLVTCSTIREASGLAMSSRNIRLSENERIIAAELYRTLQLLELQVKPGSLKYLLHEAKNRLSDSGFRVDYLEICHAGDLTIFENWDGKSPLVALVAAFLGEVRLIDNHIFETSG